MGSWLVKYKRMVTLSQLTYHTSLFLPGLFLTLMVKTQSPFNAFFDPNRTVENVPTIQVLSYLRIFILILQFHTSIIYNCLKWFNVMFLPQSHMWGWSLRTKGVGVVLKYNILINWRRETYQIYYRNVPSHRALISTLFYVLKKVSKESTPT